MGVLEGAEADYNIKCNKIKRNRLHALKGVKLKLQNPKLHEVKSMKSYNHFTLEERESLYLLLKLGKKIIEIAKELNRDKSSVSREIKRNSNKKTGQYNVWGANSLYLKRRKKSKRSYRIQKGTELYEYIKDKLIQYWSPEIIAKEWNKKHPEDTISFSTIYNAIKRNAFEDISVKTHLRRRGKRKYGKRSKFNTIQPEHTIHERPLEAELRSECGHWEGDTVKGPPGKGCIVTFVDRKSRKLVSAKSDDMSSKSVLKAIFKVFKGINPKTITLDNGSEFALFRDMERELNTTVYFADPHSPWQRGSNENINGLLRFFFPKGYDFKTLSDEYLDEVVQIINSRPRLCLDLHSPDEIFCCT